MVSCYRIFHVNVAFSENDNSQHGARCGDTSILSLEECGQEEFKCSRVGGGGEGVFTPSSVSMEILWVYVKGQTHVCEWTGQGCERSKWNYLFRTSDSFTQQIIYSVPGTVLFPNIWRKAAAWIPAKMLSSWRDESLESDMYSTMLGGRNVWMEKLNSVSQRRGCYFQWGNEGRLLFKGQ